VGKEKQFYTTYTTSYLLQVAWLKTIWASVILSKNTRPTVILSIFLSTYDQALSFGQVSFGQIIGDDISTKSSNVKININNVCNLISASSEQLNLEIN
jgi:hypothetical protein